LTFLPQRRRGRRKGREVKGRKGRVE